MPIEVAKGNADFAVGCGYKYLCGGPGAPGYLYVAPRLQAKVMPAIQGWFGHAAPMEFEMRFRPAPGVQRHVVGTPAVTGNVLLEAALDVFSRVELPELFQQHIHLSQLLIALAPKELELASPRDPCQRGGFVASSRPPDIIRFGLSPLYHRETDVRELVRRLENAFRGPY